VRTYQKEINPAMNFNLLHFPCVGLVLETRLTKQKETHCKGRIVDKAIGKRVPEHLGNADQQLR